MRRRRGGVGVFAAACLLVLSIAPAAAQEDVLRQTFTFIQNDLIVEVLTDSPGAIRVTRGQPGQVEVAARAPGGFPAAGLAGAEQSLLKLTALGAARAEYLIVVPEGVRVQIRLPDRRPPETVGGLAQIATFEWDAVPAATAPEPDPLPAPPPPDAGAGPRTRPAVPAPTADGLHTAAVAARAPRLLTLDRLGAVRTLTVRWQGDRFRIAANRPIGAPEVDGRALVIRPDAPGSEIVVEVPRTTTDFALRLGSSTALVIENGRATPLCEPIVEQWLDDGRRAWFTFTPADGRLSCRSDSVPPRRTRTGH